LLIVDIETFIRTKDRASLESRVNPAHKWIWSGSKDLDDIDGQASALDYVETRIWSIPGFSFHVVDVHVRDKGTANVHWEIKGERKFALRGFSVVRIRDGQVVETRVVYPRSKSTKRQLGLDSSSGQLALDPSEPVRHDQGSTLQNPEAEFNGHLHLGDDAPASDLNPNGRPLEVAIMEVKTKEEHWIDLQRISERPVEDRTEADNTNYYQHALQLLSKAINNPNGYTKEAKEALEYFVDLVGVTPKLITLAQAGEYGLARTTLDSWIRAGVLKVRGRQKAPARGGGKILVAELDVVRLAQEAPGRGRSWTRSKKK
jgi:hypothetical protein